MAQLTVLAAGSLEAAFGDIVRIFRDRFDSEVSLVTGPSGVLRRRIEAGAPCDLFASADTGHPAALAANGQGGPVAPFARNRLAVIAHKRLKAATASLLELMLDPSVKLGTSTPGNDPSGDYAWEMFRRADILKTGSYAALSEKALQLAGGEDPEGEPPRRADYRRLLESGEADMFVTYLTSAGPIAAASEEIDLVSLPEVLRIEADLALTVTAQDRVDAWRLAFFLFSVEGREVLARRGFERPGASTPRAPTRG